MQPPKGHPDDEVPLLSKTLDEIDGSSRINVEDVDTSTFCHPLIESSRKLLEHKLKTCSPQ